MKFAILIAVLAVQTGSAPAPAAPEEREAPRRGMTLPSGPLEERYAMPNALKSAPGCRSIVQQVQEDARRNRSEDHRTLDQEPPASLLFAVDRHVDGCREVTFLRGNSAPATPSSGQQLR